MGYTAARRELARAIRGLDQEALYIVRSERIVLSRHRLTWWAPAKCLDRFPEDDFHEFTESGSGVITHECFRLPPLWWRVVRRQEAHRAEMAGDDVQITTPHVTRRQEAAGTLRALRMFAAGYFFASEDELRELTAQIKAASFLGAPPPS